MTLRRPDANRMTGILSITLLTLIFCISSCARPEIQPPQEPAKIALVLGAGASKGFAHVGVLKVIEANGIPVHMIVGTSAGSFVGALYAYGVNAFELQRMSFAIDKKDVFDLTVPDRGFLKGEKIESHINSALRGTPMEKLRIPFYAVATDIRSGAEVVFGSGNTGSAVRASCSVPGIFIPPVISGRMYVDGGVVSPVAVDAARRLGADVVIAVDLSGDIDTSEPKGTIEVILQSVGIMYAKLSEGQLARADVVIRPKVGYLGSSDFTRRHEAVLEGEKAALLMLPKMQEIVNRLKGEGRID